MPDPDHPDPIAMWLVHLEQQGKAAATVVGYGRDLRDFARWYRDAFGEEMAPAAILPRDIEDYKAYLQTVRAAAPRTVNRRIAALSRFFKWAAGQDLAHRDPTTGTRAVRLPPRRPRALTPKDEHRLLRAVHETENWRDIAMVEVMLGTGVRVGELLALHRSDVVLRERSGTLTVRRGKGGVTRKVPLRFEARAALKSYLDQVRPQLEADDPLWQGIRGAIHDPSAINRLLDKYARWAGIPELTPHTLRHTFATRYLEANLGDLRGLAALLGHASLDTVMIYTEPSEEELAERVERTDQGRSR